MGLPDGTDHRTGHRTGSRMSSKAAARSTQPETPAWADRFHQPDAGSLLEGVGDEFREEFSKVRAWLVEEAAASETLRWRGEPCRWTLDYGDESDPVCSLCASPEEPMVVIRLSPDQCRRIAEGKPSKVVRESLEYGRIVGGRLWVEVRCVDAPAFEAAGALLAVAFDTDVADRGGS